MAVDGLSLEVTEGCLFGLLGANGAGKTTAIECILGLRLPDSGTISIGGVDALVNPELIKQRIGAQLQNSALQDKITPFEAVKFYGAFYRNSIDPNELLCRFALSEKAHAPFDSLSAGQKQKLALALAFVNSPRLVFLDEPTAGLDVGSRRELHKQILALKSTGCTVVLSTHYIEEAEQLCDQIAIIRAGRIVAAGTPAELIKTAALPDRVTVKTSPELSLESLNALPAAEKVELFPGGSQITTGSVNRLVIGLMKLIETAGVELVDLQIKRASLEEAFLKITADQ